MNGSIWNDYLTVKPQPLYSSCSTTTATTSNMPGSFPELTMLSRANFSSWYIGALPRPAVSCKGLPSFRRGNDIPERNFALPYYLPYMPNAPSQRTSSKTRNLSYREDKTPTSKPTSIRSRQERKSRNDIKERKDRKPTQELSL